jgi:predicted phosphodiesterase
MALTQRNKEKFLLLLIFIFSMCFQAAAAQPLWKLSGKPGSEAVALLISDVHFDPYVDGAAKELMTTPVSGWQAVLEKSKNSGFPPYKQDANYLLLKSSLGKLHEISSGASFAIVGGDLLCHKFEAKYRAAAGFKGSSSAFAIQTMEFISLMIKQSLPSIPVYYVMGNNDSDNGDYNITPRGAMLDSLAGYIDTLASDRRAALDFRDGGYYEEPIASLDKCEIIVLNDIFWHKKYRQPKNLKYSAARVEMQWLSARLDLAQKNGKKIFIAMHIPPGIDPYPAAKNGNCSAGDGFLDSGYNSGLIEILRSHSSVIAAVFSGHTHFDDFRVFSSTAGAFLGVYIIPSVCPSHGNNPAIEAALLSSSGIIKDRAVYSISGYGSGSDGEGSSWGLEYDFDSAYGYPDCSPGSLYSLACAIRKDPGTLDKYLGFYGAGNPLVSMLIKSHAMIYECALTDMDKKEFAACACGNK